MLIRSERVAPARAGELPSAEQYHLKIDLFRLFGRLNKRKSKSKWRLLAVGKTLESLKN